MHRRASAAVRRPSTSGLDEPLAFVSGPRLRAYLDTPAKWAMFMEYVGRGGARSRRRRSSRSTRLIAEPRAFGDGGAPRALSAGFRARVERVEGVSRAAAPAPAAVPGGAGRRDLERHAASVAAVVHRRRRARGARAGASRAPRQRGATVLPRSTASKRARASTLQRTASSYPAIELLGGSRGCRQREPGDGDRRLCARRRLRHRADRCAGTRALLPSSRAADAKFKFLIDFVDVLRARGSSTCCSIPPSRTRGSMSVERWIAIAPRRVAATKGRSMKRSNADRHAQSLAGARLLAAEAPHRRPSRARCAPVVASGGRRRRHATTRRRFCSRYEADLGFQVGGKIVTRTVDAGTVVRRGDVLAVARRDGSARRRRAARAAVRAARAELERARTEEARYPRPARARADDARGVPRAADGHEDRRSRSSSRRVAEHRCRAAPRLHDAARERDGVVTRIYADVGSVVAAGQPVVTLAQPSELEAVFDVPERASTRSTPQAPW